MKKLMKLIFINILIFLGILFSLEAFLYLVNFVENDRNLVKNHKINKNMLDAPIDTNWRQVFHQV